MQTKLGIALVLSAVLAGCDVKSTVSFANRDPSSLGSGLTHPSSGPVQGGIGPTKTAGGYTASVTLSPGTSGNTGTTASGYSTYMNSPGQTAQ